MRTTALLTIPLFVLVACSAEAPDAASAVANETAGSMPATDVWSPYPSDVRAGMQRLEPLGLNGASVGDFGSAARDQGNIASCASFSFLGLLENQMFNDRGISPDLSERYMIYSNFLQTGSLGGAPDTIAKFPQLTQNVGILPEDVFPYSAVNANAAHFDADAAQGLTTAASGPMLADAIKDSPASSEARSEIIQKPEFVGALPAGPFPVKLPLKAKLQKGAKVPEVEFQGKIVSCFSEAPELGPRLDVSPREALAMCFDLDPSQYFQCNFDQGAAIQQANALATGDDQCAATTKAADFLAQAQLDANGKSLQMALALMDHGNAAMIAVTDPAPPNQAQPVWSTKNFTVGSGHAILAVGYVTADELQTPSEQSRGILGNGYFDKLAAMVEPAFKAKLDAGLPTDPTALRDLRANSLLGQRMIGEGGMILFRNSWTTQIGYQGHQGMSFDYFLKAGILTEGRADKHIQGLTWSGSACPAGNPGYGGSWLQTKAIESLKTFYRSQAVPPTCAPSTPE